MRYKNFEIRKPTLIGEPPTKDYFKYNFDLVKWDASNSHCWSIAHLIYNEFECSFDFESVGTRYLKDREDGLEEFIMRWCKLMEIIIEGDTE